MANIQKATINAKNGVKNNTLLKVLIDKRPSFPLSKPIAIDSLRMLIPLKYFDDERLIVITKNSTFVSTGETVSDQLTERQTMYSETSDCKTITAYYKLTIRKKQKKSHEFVEVAFSSKILKHQYHEGIQSKNIHIIYDFITNQNFLKDLTFEKFLQIELEDVDIKYDVKIPLNKYEIFINHLPNSIINTKNEKRYTKYLKQHNVGLQINKRSLSTVNSKQHLKFYFKSLEMDYSKNNFFSTYYKCDNPNISRVEATIPNQRQFQKYLPNKAFNLNTLLKLNQSEYQLIFTWIFSYLLKENKMSASIKDEKSENTTVAKFIRESLNMPTKPNRLDSIECNYKNLLEKYDNWFPGPKDKHKKTRIKKVTKLVYNSMIIEAKNYIKMQKKLQKTLKKTYKKTFRDFDIKP